MSKKLSKKSITYKVFFITALLLFFSALLIYLTIYFVLPNYYMKYKKNALEKGVDNLVWLVQKEDFQGAVKIMDNYVKKNNVTMVVHNSSGKILYISKGLINFIEIPKGSSTVVPQFGTFYIQSRNEQPLGSAGSLNPNGIYSVKREVSFTDSSEQYYIVANATLQPIGEASQVILRLAPYIVLAIIFISTLGAYIYSRIISLPLIQINNVARKMAGLDFSSMCEVKSEDELGELSSNLNELSSNLMITMKELQDANRKLKDDIERERELELKRREFITTISHELKSPIAAVKGQLEAMINNIGVYKDRDKYLRRSFSIMEDMENLVLEVLQIYKMESEGFEPIKSSVNVSRILYETMEAQEYFIDSKKIELCIEVEEELYTYADEKLIKKVFQNVVNNAVKYSPEHEKINVKLWSSDGKLRLEVENTGVSIEDEHISQIFKPFYRLEKSRNRKSGGSGLGLHIVKTILDAHKFKFGIINTDKGVAFQMEFTQHI